MAGSRADDRAQVGEQEVHRVAGQDEGPEGAAEVDDVFHGMHGEPGPRPGVVGLVMEVVESSVEERP